MKDSTRKILNQESDRDYGASYCKHCGARCITNNGVVCPNHGELDHNEITSNPQR